jgi:hypothetical protein
MIWKFGGDIGLLSNRKAIKSLKQGLKEAKAGKFYSFKDVFGEEQRQIPIRDIRKFRMSLFLCPRGQQPQQASKRCRFEFRQLFERETENGIPFPTYHCAGDIHGGVLIGPNMKFYGDIGRNMNGACQPTAFEG